MKSIGERFVGIKEKGKSMIERNADTMRRFIASVLCVVFILTSLVASISSNAFASVSTLKNQINTQYGLNSPLLGNEVTAEAFEKWELEVFGMFLSNFSIPFVDSLDSAFGVDKSYGTAGAGLDALVFSCGGDIQSRGILYNMVTYVLDQAASINEASNRLKVSYTVYRKGSPMAMPSGADAKSTVYRDATLADLIINGAGAFLYSDDSTQNAIDSWSIGDSNLPVTTASASTSTDNDILESGWVVNAIGEEAGNSDIHTVKPYLACLPTLYIGEEASKITAFDLGDGWDSQVLSVCLNYGLIKAAEVDADEECDTKDAMASLNKMIACCKDYPLYMDCIGNIVVQYNNRYIVVIPACMNKNLTKTSLVNLVTAPLLNDICRAGGLDIAGYISNQCGLINDDDYKDFGMPGLGLGMDTSGKDSDDSAEHPLLAHYGNILIYNTSDTTIDWNTGAVSLDGVKEIMTSSGVNFKRNLCISIVGNAYRLGSNAMSTSDGNEDTLDASGLSTSIQGITGNRGYVADASNATDLEIAAYKNIGDTVLLGLEWGVAKGNNLSDVHTEFYNSLNGTTDIFVEKNVTYVSGTVHANADNITRSAGYWAIGGAASAAAGIAAGLIVSNPVGWVVGIVGGIVTVAIAIFNDDDLGYIPKVSMAATLMYANTPFDPGDDNYYPIYESNTQIKSNIQAYNSIEELSYYVATLDATGGTVNTTDILAATFANNKIEAYRLRDNSVNKRSELYNKLIRSNMYDLNDKADLDGDESALVVNEVPDSKKAYTEALGYSVSVVNIANPSLVQARNYLCLADDTTFAALAPYMYLSYLKCYGFGKENSVDKIMNEALFKALGSRLCSDVDESIYDLIFGSDGITEDQKRQRTQEYTYLSLAPTAEGVEYRNQLLTDGIYQWMATEYNQICYGDGYVSAIVKGSSTGANGFLQMTSYSENNFTSFMVENWNRILVISTLIFVAIIIIMGAVKGRKFTWFIANIFVTVLVLVMLPSSGEITPYVCEKIVQNMFEKGQQYWSVSEAIENEYLVQEAIDATSDMDYETAALIRSMSVSQTSKYLTVKHDISKKVINMGDSDIEKFMGMASTRWMLSSLLRQFSADTEEEKYNYVYTTLDDTRGKLKDVYLMYANISGSLTAKYGDRKMIENAADVDSSSNTWWKYSNIPLMWKGWTDITKNKAFSSTDKFEDAYKWQSVTLRKGTKDVRNSNYHFAFGYLAHMKYPMDTSDKNLTLESIKSVTGNKTLTVSDIDKFQEKIADATALTGFGSKDRWKSLTRDIIMQGVKNYSDSGATQDFGYLYMTEDVIPYFYMLVKDTFSYNYTLDGEQISDTADGIVRKDTFGTGQLASLLLGTTSKNTITGKVSRASIMHTMINDESYVRDVLDLETLFTNYMPYMVEVMSITGGTDGTNGKLKGTKLGNCKGASYTVYSNTDASWLYRCNWVLKLIGSPQYNGIVTVKDSTGNAYKVECPLFPQNYPENRPMVFSDAQKVAMGLSDSDLNVVELACIDVNNRVVDNWTMLVNYVNTDGITREIIEEQMALEAAMIFNSVIQPDDYISSKMALYPTSLDLRAINFDSVMKLLIISNNYNSASLKQDAILTIIADKGFWGGIIAWLIALFCVVVIPAMRNFVLAGIFYCSMCACVFNVLNDNKQKAKTVGGALASNIAFTIVTILYYGVFSLLITRAGGESILTQEGFNMGTSSIMLKLLVILVASLGYMFFMVVYIFKLVRNFKDMGAGIWEQYLHGAVSAITGAVDKIRGKFGSSESAERSRSKAARDANESLGSTDTDGKVEGDVTVKDGKVTIDNSKDKAIPTFEARDVDDPVYVAREDIEQTSDSSGYVEETAEQESDTKSSRAEADMQYDDSADD